MTAPDNYSDLTDEEFRQAIIDKTASLLADQFRSDRRERIATAALQGCLIHSQAWSSPEKAATWAVEFADALIAELDVPSVD